VASKFASRPADITEVFKAFSDPIRWLMVVEMAQVDELPATALEDIVPVKKPTISYHVKVLYHAGLLEVRKDGRNFFYRLRRDVLRDVLRETSDQLRVPMPRRRAQSA
jgi:DNA-binding transcriptional ArsR family regulator